MAEKKRTHKFIKKAAHKVGHKAPAESAAVPHAGMVGSKSAKRYSTKFVSKGAY